MQSGVCCYGKVVYLTVPVHIWCGFPGQRTEEESHRSETKHKTILRFGRCDCIDKNAAYPVIHVDVYSVSQERLHNVHITPGARQCQGALSLPCNCFWVCTLRRKREIFSPTMQKSCHTVADLFLTLSRRKSTVLFSPNAAAHIRGVKPRSSCLLSSEVSAKIRQKETTIKGGRQSAQDSISEGLASSPLLRCAATSETSPWAANWCMDSADGRVYTALYLWHNVVRYFTIKAYWLLKAYSLLTLGVKSSHSHAACWSDWWSVWTNTLYPCLCSLETLALWPAEESIQLIKWVTLHSIK